MIVFFASLCFKIRSFRFGDLNFVTTDFDNAALADVGHVSHWITIDLRTGYGHPILYPKLSSLKADTAMDVGDTGVAKL